MLIADDEVNVARTLQLIFEQAGYAVTVVNSAALKIAASDVDHGNATTVRIANRSTVSRQAAGLRRRRHSITPVVSLASAVTCPLPAHDGPAPSC